MGQLYNGDGLRMIRNSKGIELSSIAEKTRISKRYLEYIEEDNYQYLPAVIYLKGYLIQYALCLDLNPAEVVRQYLGYFMDWAIKNSPLFSAGKGNSYKEESPLSLA